MPKPQDQDDVKLLDELMNGPAIDDIAADQSSGFSAQWNQMFGNSESSVQGKMSGAPAGEEDEFSQFISARSGNPGQNSSAIGDGANSSLLLGSDLVQGASRPSTASTLTDSSSNFLPSQLFDLNQSLNSAKGPSNVGKCLKSKRQLYQFHFR